MTAPTRPDAPLVLSGRDVTAVLGPTNTGKTHLAIERLVAHESGVIGLPLRLLAREVYGRVCDKVGADKVALVTGEEKIQPPGARYFVCTVEAMPRETDAAFVAIDEVQLAADLERGHIFTDRILHLRGRQETLLLGAATMRGILEKLLRGVSVVTIGQKQALRKLKKKGKPTMALSKSQQKEVIARRLGVLAKLIHGERYDGRAGRTIGKLVDEGYARWDRGLLLITDAGRAYLPRPGITIRYDTKRIEALCAIDPGIAAKLAPCRIESERPGSLTIR